MRVLAQSNVSTVWLADDGWVYKRQPRFLTDNEFWCLTRLAPAGYVPAVRWVDYDLLQIEYIPDAAVTQPDEFMSHLPKVLGMLTEYGIRHGDLTVYAIRVRDNRPIIIDWSESRLACDPRPDKRREGDKWWLTQSMTVLSGVIR